jgi:hypothetical protein
MQKPIMMVQWGGQVELAALEEKVAEEGDAGGVAIRLVANRKRHRHPALGGTGRCIGEDEALVVPPLEQPDRTWAGLHPDLELHWRMTP